MDTTGASENMEPELAPSAPQRRFLKPPAVPVAIGDPIAVPGTGRGIPLRTKVVSSAELSVLICDGCVACTRMTPAADPFVSCPGTLHGWGEDMVLLLVRAWVTKATPATPVPMCAPRGAAAGPAGAAAAAGAAGAAAAAAAAAAAGPGLGPGAG